LALFGHKITLYRFNQGGSYYCRGLKREQGLRPPGLPHFNHYVKYRLWPYDCFIGLLLFICAYKITNLKVVNTRSSADAEKPARRDIVRREEKYRQLVRPPYRRIVCGGNINVLAGRRTACSGWNFLSQPESNRILFPLEFRDFTVIFPVF